MRRPTIRPHTNTHIHTHTLSLTWYNTMHTATRNNTRVYDAIDFYVMFMCRYLHKQMMSFRKCNYPNWSLCLLSLVQELIMCRCGMRRVSDFARDIICIRRCRGEMGSVRLGADSISLGCHEVPPHHLRPAIYGWRHPQRTIASWYSHSALALTIMGPPDEFHNL